MVSREDNELMTRVGPGTPCGDLLRRYWMPVCPAIELTKEKPKKRIKILGEDLVLFRDGAGRYGLVAEQCAHRRASLYYGFVEEDGLRCPYHGWKYDVSGQCIEMPFEPKGTPLMQEACQAAYPVEQLAGILFAYMGPKPVPLLPRYEHLVRKDGKRRIAVLPVHRCNWLQAQENSVDPVHTYWLHGGTLKSLGLQKDKQDYYMRPIENYEFEVVHATGWSGIRKVRIYGGENAEREGGHPAIFPNILMNAQGKQLATKKREIVSHWRVPLDDENTHILWCGFTPSDDGTEIDQPDDQIPVSYADHPMQPDGEYDLSTFFSQDLMAWETQGPLYDRSQELLGRSDSGIAMWRKLLRQQIEAVKAGKDPAGVIRDPKQNEIIRFGIDDRSKNALAAE
jgi:5,5'-dehydrodivanillate O-demethylase